MWSRIRKSPARRSAPRKILAPPCSTRLALDELEDRRLLAVITSVNANVLTVVLETDEDVAITTVAGNVKINGADPTGGARASSTLTGIVISGLAQEANEIDLTGVDAADFTSLATLSVSAGPDPTTGTLTDSILIDGTMTVTGSMTFSDPVRLNSSTTLNANSVSFQSTVNSNSGNRSLAVNVASGVIFSGTVGFSGALASLTTSGAGNTTLNTDVVVTTGDQSYNTPVFVAVNINLSGATIVFDDTLDSESTPRTFKATVSASIAFNGVVGGINPLASIHTLSGNQTVIGASAITTSSSLLFENDVQLTNSTTLTSANITFEEEINAAVGAALVVNADLQTHFNKGIGVPQALASLTVGGGGSTYLEGPVNTTGAQIYDDDVFIGPEASFDGGSYQFNGAIVTAPPDGTNPTWLENLYFQTLRRPIDDFGAASWLSLLNGGTSRVDVAQGVLGSTEYRTNLLESWYDTYLGRALDDFGRDGWLSYFEQGAPFEQILLLVLLSDEYYNKAGGTTDLLADALAGDLWGAQIDPAEVAGLDRVAVVIYVLGDGRHTARLINGGLQNEEFNLKIGNWFGRTVQRQADPNEVGVFQTAVSQLSQGIRWTDAFAYILGSNEDFDL